MEVAHIHRISTPTGIGLAIALFASPAFVSAFRLITGENQSNAQILAREAGLFALLGLLLWIVKRWEHLPLRSIGLSLTAVRTSLLRGLLLTLLILAVTVLLYLALQALGVRLGQDSPGFHPSRWVVTLIMLRAGIAEEIFYRGYAIERLQTLTGSRWASALLPLTLFALAHYRQGVGGIGAAFVLGGIFTAFYLKYRDLLATITAHFLGDFVLNVLLPIVSGG